MGEYEDKGVFVNPHTHPSCCSYAPLLANITSFSLKLKKIDLLCLILWPFSIWVSAIKLEKLAPSCWLYYSQRPWKVATSTLSNRWQSSRQLGEKILGGKHGEIQVSVELKLFTTDQFTLLQGHHTEYKLIFLLFYLNIYKVGSGLSVLSVWTLFLSTAGVNFVWHCWSQKKKAEDFLVAENAWTQFADSCALLCAGLAGSFWVAVKSHKLPLTRFKLHSRCRRSLWFYQISFGINKLIYNLCMLVL